MSKTEIRRHHTRRLIGKYKRLQQHSYGINDELLSFGRVFSKDPFDCSITQCFLCRKDISKPRNNNIKVTRDIDLVDTDII